MEIYALTLLVCSATTAAAPPHLAAKDRVDLIEINHFYDEHGRRVFDQVIFYDWSSDECRYQVRAWRLLKSPAQVPLKRWRHDDYFATWHDGDIFRQVSAESVRESWTQYDPELLEREFLPKEQRRELLRPGRP